MVEQTITPTINGEYKNISLKSNKAKGVVGIEDGNHIVITKLYDDNMELQGKWGPFYSVKATYGEDEVSFLLSSRENEAFAKTGLAGTKVKITLNKELVTNPKTGVESIMQRLSFEKVE